MANCPRCNKPIPAYKSLQIRGIRGIICDFCGTKSFMNKSSVRRSGWYIGVFIGAVIVSLPTHYFSILIFLNPVLLLLFWYTIIWNRITLEIRD
jgi:hypothetical protein